MTDIQPIEPLLDKVVRFQNALIARATGGDFDGGDAEYQQVRREMMEQNDVGSLLPDFVRRCRDTNQFWQFIRSEYASYAERRMFIWNEFRSLVDYLESSDRTPGMLPIGAHLEAFDVTSVHAAWQKALNRRASDPEGAITAARTLLETVCKHILDDAGTVYQGDSDLPKLWALAAESLNLAPNQHQEPLFKTILGNCQSIVNTVGAIRNKIGDAHGQGRRPVRPKPRHAELVVNLAGSMAAFLVATWRDRPNSEHQV